MIEEACQALCLGKPDCLFYTWFDIHNRVFSNYCFLFSSCDKVCYELFFRFKTLPHVSQVACNCVGCSSGPPSCAPTFDQITPLPATNATTLPTSKPTSVSQPQLPHSDQKNPITPTPSLPAKPAGASKVPLVSIAGLSVTASLGQPGSGIQSSMVEESQGDISVTLHPPTIPTTSLTTQHTNWPGQPSVGQDSGLVPIIAKPPHTGGGGNIPAGGAPGLPVSSGNGGRPSLIGGNINKEEAPSNAGLGEVSDNKPSEGGLDGISDVINTGQIPGGSDGSSPSGIGGIGGSQDHKPGIGIDSGNGVLQDSNTGSNETSGINNSDDSSASGSGSEGASGASTGVGGSAGNTENGGLLGSDGIDGGFGSNIGNGKPDGLSDGSGESSSSNTGSEDLSQSSTGSGGLAGSNTGSGGSAGSNAGAEDSIESNDSTEGSSGPNTGSAGLPNMENDGSFGSNNEMEESAESNSEQASGELSSSNVIEGGVSNSDTGIGSGIENAGSGGALGQNTVSGGSSGSNSEIGSSGSSGSSSGSGPGASSGSTSGSGSSGSSESTSGSGSSGSSGSNSNPESDSGGLSGPAFGSGSNLDSGGSLSSNSGSGTSGGSSGSNLGSGSASETGGLSGSNLGSGGSSAPVIESSGSSGSHTGNGAVNGGTGGLVNGQNDDKLSDGNHEDKFQDESDSALQSNNNGQYPPVGGLPQNSNISSALWSNFSSVGSSDLTTIQIHGTELDNVINNLLSDKNITNTAPAVSGGSNNVIINMPSFGEAVGQIIQTDSSQSVGGEISNFNLGLESNSTETNSSQSIKATILNYMPSLKWLFVFIDN